MIDNPSARARQVDTLTKADADDSESIDDVGDEDDFGEETDSYTPEPIFQDAKIEDGEVTEILYIQGGTMGRLCYWRDGQASVLSPGVRTRMCRLVPHTKAGICCGFFGSSWDMSFYVYDMIEHRVVALSEMGIDLANEELISLSIDNNWVVTTVTTYEIPHTPLMVCFHRGDVYYVSMFGNRLYRASARSKYPDLIRLPPNCRKVAGLWSLGSHLLLLSADDHHMYTADGNGWRFSSDLAWTDNIVADVALSHDSVEQLQLLQYPKPGRIDCVYRLVRHNRRADGADELMFSLPLRGAVQMRLLPEAVDGLACVCQQTDGSGKVSSTPSALFTIRVVNFLTGVSLITSEGFSSFGIVSMVVTDAWHVAAMGEVLTEYLDDDDVDELHRVALKGMQFVIHSLTLHA
ncbi:hypothetical protein FOZ63_007925 [Perkinsus olseni]|uniref:Uncharacterized protein n=1 Tax=Perkinsus olseni TaxID=32597 RepID=A0A7J6Q0Y6_PEROL|nr:hypothetical protein FOZ63_007925 [Perkinsus olseni]